MPLAGYVKECDCDADFQHPNGSGKEVDCVSLDHYAFECPEPPLSRILAHALYRATEWERYGQTETAVSATLLLKCPLALLMEERHTFVEKVLDSRWKLRGTFAHEGILGAVEGSEDWLVEQPLRLDVTCEDRRVVSIFGRPDAYYRPLATLYDLKTQREYAIKLKNQATDEELLGSSLLGTGGSKEGDFFVKENAMQLNIYRLMAKYGQVLDPRSYSPLAKADWEVDALELQYMDGGLRVRELPVPIIDEEKVGAFIRKRAYLMDRVLKGELRAEEVPVKSWDRFNPVQKSGVWFRVKEVLEAA